MSHDRGCAHCGTDPNQRHESWCRSVQDAATLATREQLGRQGHDESPPGIRASLDQMKTVPVWSKPSAPPDPIKGRPNYGGFDNLECAGELTAIYDKWALKAAQTGTRAPQSAGHEHAIRMVLMKISRIATGTFDVDHYDDAKVYAELAKQIRHSGQEGAR